MNKWLEVLLGLILVIAPIVLAINYAAWGTAAAQFIKGGIIVGVILIGLLFLMLGISDLKG